MEPRIIFTLINRQKNLELLNRVPHRNFLDLSVIYRLLADFSGETVYSAIITDAIAKEMGMTEEQLYQQAVMTTRKEMPPLVDTLDKGFYLITNCTLVMGAVTIFYRDILQELAEKETDDLYIIPSSIHEVFAVPVKAVDGSGLALLIKDINRRFVDDSAVLSDQLYLYDRKERASRFAHSIVN